MAQGMYANLQYDPSIFIILEKKQASRKQHTENKVRQITNAFINPKEYLFSMPDQEKTATTQATGHLIRCNYVASIQLRANPCKQK